MMTRTSIAFLASLSLVACGGSSTKSNPDAKAPAAADAAPPPGTPDAPPAAACTVPAEITGPLVEGATGNTYVIRGTNTSNKAFLEWDFITNTDAKPDIIAFDHDDPVALNTPLDLAAGCVMGGTFCLVGLGDFDQTTMMETQTFFPDSGTITITEAGAVGGRFKATITDATLSHYDATGAPLDDGCGTHIASLSIDVAVVAAQKPGRPGAATANPGLGMQHVRASAVAK